MSWEPIDTAPLDGTWILAACDGVSKKGVAWIPSTVAYYKGRWYSSELDTGYSLDEWPLQWWMPIPTAPSGKKYPKINEGDIII